MDKCVESDGHWMVIRLVGGCKTSWILSRRFRRVTSIRWMQNVTFHSNLNWTLRYVVLFSRYKTTPCCLTKKKTGLLKHAILKDALVATRPPLPFGQLLGNFQFFFEFLWYFLRKIYFRITLPHNEKISSSWIFHNDLRNFGVIIEICLIWALIRL